MIKLKSILLENNILISRRNKEERLKYYRASLYKKIKKYIKNGCKGDLDLNQLAIDKLPDELKYIGGNLFIIGTNIETFPDNLRIDGYVYADGSELKKIPNNLFIRGNIYTYHTPLSDMYTNDEIRNLIIDRGGYVRYVNP